MSTSTSTTSTASGATSYAKDVPADVRFFQRLVGLSVIGAWIAIPLVGYWLYQKAEEQKLIVARAQACGQRGDHACAVQAWREVIGFKSDDMNAWGGLCRARSHLGDYQATISDCGVAIERIRLQADADYLLAEMFAARAGAFETLPAPDYKRAASDWQTCADLPRADKTMCLIRRARVDLLLGDTTAALRDTAEAITASTSTTIEAHRIRANLALQAGRILETIASWDAILSQESNNVELRLQRADLLLAANEGTRAEADFNYLLQRSNRDALALAGLGDVALASGKVSRAMTLYQKAVRHDPGSAIAQAGLAHALVLVGKGGEASLVLRRIGASSSDVRTSLRLGRAEAALCTNARTRRWCDPSLREKARVHLEEFLQVGAGGPWREAVRMDLAQLTKSSNSLGSSGDGSSLPNARTSSMPISVSTHLVGPAGSSPRLQGAGSAQPGASAGAVDPAELQGAWTGNLQGGGQIKLIVEDVSGRMVQAMAATKTADGQFDTLKMRGSLDGRSLVFQADDGSHLSVRHRGAGARQVLAGTWQTKGGQKLSWTGRK